MEWIQRMNEALAYLEAHLTGTIDYDEAARIACCSGYHFRRMFGYLAGMPLSEYIRRRKMSLAAADLQSGEEKIIDIAGKYGYDSPTAFSRAFQSVHGFPPSQTREPGRIIRSFPPISFQITVRGVTPLEYRIEQRPAFRIVGKSAPLSATIEENFSECPNLWADAAQNGLLPRLAGLMDGEPMGMLGISTCGEDAENWTYWIGAASSAPAGDLEETVIPAFTWAVFPGCGTNLSIQELERRVVTEWLPTSGYEYANGPDVEVYLSPDPADARYEVWIPVVKVR